MQNCKLGKNSPFSNKDYNYVVNYLHKKSERNAAKAERIFNGKCFLEEKVKITITRQTILRWWKIEELETNSRGGYRHGVLEKIFRKVHEKSKGNINEIERYLRRFKIKKTQIKNRCRQYNLPYC